MILVTGGTGMLGTFIVHELQQRKVELRILARKGSEKNARVLGSEVFLGDLADAERLRRAARDVKGIIHAACTFWKPEVDVAAMAALLEAWERGPFVFISSVSVYGESLWLPTTEDHPLNDTSNYGRGKIRCEALLQEAARAQERKDWSILRPPHIWGPDVRCISNKASPVAWLHDRAQKGQPLVLPGVSEEEWAQYGDDWVDARELAWAVAECLERPLGEAANVINSHFTWHDFCVELIRLTGSPSTIEHKPLEAIHPDELPTKSFFAQSWCYSDERLKRRLGFRPSRSWQETLAEIVPAEG